MATSQLQVTPWMTKLHARDTLYRLERLPKWKEFLTTVAAAIDTGQQPDSPTGEELAKRWMCMLAVDANLVGLGLGEVVPGDETLRDFLSRARDHVIEKATEENLDAMESMRGPFLESLSFASLCEELQNRKAP